MTRRSAYGLDSPHADDWRRRGICLRVDPDVMTPHAGDAKGIAAAREVCAFCPVKQQCLDDAIERGDFGPSIRAGLTGTERRRLVRRQVTCPACRALTWRTPSGGLVPHRVPGRARSHPYCTPATAPIGASS